MVWEVLFPKRVMKQINGLPKEVKRAVRFLADDLKAGPAAIQWPYFGKLKNTNNCYHCHLRKGRPTYVAVWQVIDKKAGKIEVLYVGTHEGADYRRLC
jgi:mRNA-degrading endonuclease RelE of RelBE toxin-antitoxin system